MKKRERYGTIMVDLLTHRTIDLLASRKAEDVAEWLKTYPNLVLVSRDGSLTYKKAIATAHPEAQQVSDRFHLFKNLTEYGSDYLKKVMKPKVIIPTTRPVADDAHIVTLSVTEKNRQLTLEEKYQQLVSLQQAGTSQTQICQALNLDSRVYKKMSQLTKQDAIIYFSSLKKERRHAKGQQKMARVEAVRQLKHEGLTISAIQQETGLNYRTIKKYLSPEFDPTHPSTGQTQSSILDKFKNHITYQLKCGAKASTIEKEIREQGYNGSSSTIRHYCSEWKKIQPLLQKNENLKEHITTEVVERKRLLKLLYQPIEMISSLTQQQVDRVQEIVPEFKKIHQLIWEFKTLVSEKQVDRLADWLVRAQQSGISELGSFVTGVTRDIEAIKQAIIREANNGLAEGSVNKLKVIKRIMYGRCHFETLRCKMLQLEDMRKPLPFN